MSTTLETDHASTEWPDRRIERVYPLRWEDGQPVPFPTIYWLTDPVLDRAIADLERQGWIARLEARVAEDAELREAVRADHERYRRQRWEMLGETDRGVAANSASLSRSFRGGIGGVADFTHLKCLHAHVAHALADRNAIGSLVLGMIPA